MTCNRPRRNRPVGECGERARHALTLGLMAGDAAAAVDLPAHRNHQWVVHLEKVVFVLLRPILYLIPRRRQLAVEGDVFTEIIVAPLPLITRDLDGDIRARCVLHRDHGPGSRERQADNDQDGNDRPHDLHERVLAELLGSMTYRSTMPDDGVKHEPEHYDPYQDADPVDDRVQIVYLMRDDGLRCLQPELRLAAGDGHAWKRQRCGRNRFREFYCHGYGARR